jgi:two-component system, chemotaxis family, protein-glutamate methylesterase/glutaminase
MPKEAIAHGGVDRVVALDQIAREILAADRRR